MGLLDEIVARKRVDVAARRTALPRGALAARAATLAPPRSLAAALTPRAAGEVRILAELKRASPVKGVLADGLRPRRPGPRVRPGRGGGPLRPHRPHFQGSLDDLDTGPAPVDCPVLEKDFVIDEYQLWEARGHGADAILLIVAILEPDRLADLFQAAKGLGLSALVEVHREAELDRARGPGRRRSSGSTTGTSRPSRPTSRPPSGSRPRAPAGPSSCRESGIATRTATSSRRWSGRRPGSPTPCLVRREALSRSGRPAGQDRASCCGTAP